MKGRLDDGLFIFWQLGGDCGGDCGGRCDNSGMVRFLQIRAQDAPYKGKHMPVLKQVYVTREELTALTKLADCELRDPQSQASILIRQRLKELSLLPTDPALTDLAHDKPQPAEVMP